MFIYNLNKNQKWTRIFLVVSFFLFFSVFLGYLNYNECIETDFPTSKAKFENLDQDYLLTSQGQKLELFGSSYSTMIVEINSSGKYLFFSLQKSSHNQKAIILRC